jgi:REP element-mobilizing transposase RayT
MPQSLSKLYLHLTFHVKTSGKQIDKDIATELYAYIGSIINDLDSHPIIINGTSDHIHILCAMSKNISTADFIEDIKRHSIRWIKTKGLKYRTFAWQGGYGAFSVSPSLLDKTKTYIENQEKHHKTMTFHDEYVAFLKEYGIMFDERYFLTD